MKRIRESFGHAAEGFAHALCRERNLRIFTVVYVLILLIGAFLRLLLWEWLALILAGGLFLSVELLNTALERLSDVLDHERKLLGRTEYHAGMKWTKDVAAAASLVSLLAVIAVVVIVFLPYVKMYFRWI